MRDPLQTRPSSYEILGIPPTAGNKDVDRAFGEKVALGMDLPRFQAARNSLRRPGERLQEDVLFYVPDFLEQLGLNGDESELQRELTANRQRVLQRWLDLQKAQPPQVPETHSIAVLAYWWALCWEESRVAQAAGKEFRVSGCPEPVDSMHLWKLAFGNWVFLLHSRDHTQQWARASGRQEMPEDSLWDQQVVSMEALLAKDLNRFREEYRNLDQMERSQSLGELAEWLEIENSAAKILKKMDIVINVQGRSMNIHCGPEMLKQLDLLDDVRLEVQMVQQRPREARPVDLSPIEWYLSVFAMEYHLLQKGRFGEVRNAVLQMKAKRRKQPAARYLLAKACMGLAEQLFTTEQYREAFACWEEGLQTGQITEDLGASIVKNCMSRVPYFRSDPLTVLNILEMGVQLTPDPELRSNLVELCLQHSANIINEAQRDLEKILQETAMDKVEPDLFEQVLQQIQEGIRYLEKAVALDPANETSSMRLNESKAIYEVIKALRLMSQAEWYEAVTVLEEALGFDRNHNQAADMHCYCCRTLAWKKYKTNGLDEARLILARGKQINPRLGNQFDLELADLLNTEGVRLAKEGAELIHQGSLRGALQQYDEALVLLDEAYEVHPGDAFVENENDADMETITNNQNQVRLERDILLLILDPPESSPDPPPPPLLPPDPPRSPLPPDSTTPPPPPPPVRRSWKQWLRDHRWVAAVVIPMVLAYLMKG